MKPLLFALSSVALATATTTTARAESSVQLYGVVDTFVQTLQAERSVQRLQSGGLAASRFGLRGREDLGEGLEAFFVLEGGLNADDGTLGQNGTLFGRQALVGLRGPFGSVSGGRHQGSLFTTTVEFSAFAAGNAGPSTALIGGFGRGYEPVRGSGLSASPNGGPVRASNALRYESPSWGGIKASVLYGAGETTGSAGRGHLVDVGLRATQGAFDLIAATAHDEVKTGAGVPAVRATTSSVAARYRAGAWRVLGGYLDFNDRRPSDQDGKGLWAGVEYRAGKFTWKTQYVVNHLRAAEDADSRALGVGLVYEFTRRTAVYGSITRFSNDGGAGVAGLGRFNAAVPGQLTSVARNDISELVAGVRHSF